MKQLSFCRAVTEVQRECYCVSLKAKMSVAKMGEETQLIYRLDLIPYSANSYGSWH